MQVYFCSFIHQFHLFSAMPKNKDFDTSTVKGRLLCFLSEKRLSQSEFGRILGVAPTYVGAMRKSLSADKVARLTRAFPDLNREWLLYGEGEMIKDPTADADAAAEPNEYEVPLLPVSAFAGNLQMWSQAVALKDCERMVSPVRGADFAIRITGDSMEPLLHDGSTILIKRINEKAFIPWGNPMVIDSENGVLVKDVFPSEHGRAFIEARSVNPKYPPLTIPTDSIYGLYRVMGCVRLFSTI